MKTLEECKNEIAKRKGFSTFNQAITLTRSQELWLEEIAKLYANECLLQAVERMEEKKRALETCADGSYLYGLYDSAASIRQLLKELE